MTQQPYNRDTVDALLSAFASGKLDEEKRAELEEILKTDPTARQRYLDYIGVDAMLRWRFGGVKLGTVQPHKPVLIKWWSIGLGVAAAAALVIGLSLFFVPGRQDQGNSLANISNPPPASNNVPQETSTRPPEQQGIVLAGKPNEHGSEMGQEEMGGASYGEGSPMGGALPPRELYTGVEIVKFSPDGKCLACYYRETESVTVYNSSDRTKIVSFKVKAMSSSPNPFLAFSQDSKRIVFTGCFSIQVFQLPSGELVKELGDNHERASSLSAAFTADGTQLLTGNYAEVLFWDIGTAGLIKKSALADEDLNSKGTSGLTHVFSSGKRVLAITHLSAATLPDKTVAWDPVGNKTINKFRGKYIFVSNDLKLLGTLKSADDSYLFSSAQKTVSIWEIETGKELMTMKLDGEDTAMRNVTMTAFALSSDNQNILFFKKPNDLVAIRLSDRKEVFRKHFERNHDYPDFVHDIHCSPANNGEVAVGMRNNILEIFEVK